MRVVVAADEARPVVDHVARHLGERGHEARVLPVQPWGKAALAVARAVARGEADFGVVCCWTGTGVTIAANKVPGVRAALVGDAATAAGARRWNDANVLGLSLRTLSEPVATEILDAWLGAAYEGSEGESLADIRDAERGAT
ncbi:MAG: RpiB/LacA/LacB family sugar-phosphate isomerase [Myxococcales bacterium]|nr:RpiB/LacA/LacB family sugar-phosphate isomerase [Myxococcales bacterium]